MLGAPAVDEGRDYGKGCEMRKKKEQPQKRRPMAWVDTATRVVEEFANEADLDSLHVNCVKSALRIDAQTDCLLAAIYLASIIGGVALLLTANLNLWVGAPIFLALACMAVGLGLTVRHARILGRLTLHADATISDDESAVEQFERLQGEAGSADDLRRSVLVLGALLAAGAIVAHFWHYAWRAALIALGLKALMTMLGALQRLARKLRGRRHGQ